MADEDPELDVDAAALTVWAEQDLDDVSVLILVATGRREVRVVAGPRLMQEAPEDAWQAVADAVAAGFRAGDPASGVRTALALIAPVLERGVAEAQRLGG